MGMSADSTIGRLRMESVSLDLMATLIGSKAFAVMAGGERSQIPHRQCIAVNMTVDILQEEYAEHHTIASLSRRVGINECYLKSAFRTLTGHTIADYLRRVRMEKARAMIESHGKSVTEAATFVGYSNPSHFAAGFRKVHGILPSNLKNLYDL
jgi:AraC-like DNA-binding protein